MILCKLFLGIYGRDLDIDKNCFKTRNSEKCFNSITIPEF